MATTRELLEARIDELVTDIRELQARLREVNHLLSTLPAEQPGITQARNPRTIAKEQTREKQ